MKSRRNSTSSLLFGLLLALLAPAEAKSGAPQRDAEVQTLANFPALQRLGARDDARLLRRFIGRVASAYRTAGYGDFADALPGAGSLISLFGKPERAARSGTLREARAALRRLGNGLSKNRRILLPGHVGERIPNYYLLAAAFVENAGRALKNLSVGKNVANLLRHKSASLWMTRENGDTFKVETSGASTDNMAGSIGSSSVTVLTLGPDAELPTGPPLTIGSGSIVSISFAGTLIIPAPETWVIFPPGVEIPADFPAGTVLYRYVASTINGVEYPAGTRLVKISDPSTALPDGALLLATPATIQVMPTPTPSPTPGE
ncbi:MAG: hypothetical protein PHC88_07255 [Terrimicrobiaceae bacterium]|nr:hypothetical protein [Terrimicrobiaceae bacterium]